MMKNTVEIARKWIEFLASRPEFQGGSVLLDQFAAGTIARLCDCGCNGYEFSLSSNVCKAVLAPPSERGGLAFELAFQTTESGASVELLLFVDAEGNLAGLDVDFCGNSSSMPDEVSLIEPPYHVHGPLTRS
jgi:hypothetical protein